MWQMRHTSTAPSENYAESVKLNVADGEPVFIAGCRIFQTVNEGADGEYRMKQAS